jgi:uncharacterized protein (DUF1015 family)
MANVRPFRALRPRPADAARVASVPYDVVSTDEARVLAAENPLSFLRVTRAELELPPGTDPYSDAVYDRARRNLEALRESTLVMEHEPSVYCYRLRMAGHEQTGIAACFSLDEYDNDIIKKHERTRPDKEDDRTRHILAVGAQTGVVFLAYRAVSEITGIVTGVVSGEPLFDFEASDGVRHTVWRVAGAERDAIVAAFGGVPAIYIADGHHRAASAARARKQAGDLPRATSSISEGNGSTFIAVAFPHDQVRILPYNRVVRDLAGLSPDAFLRQVGERFQVEANRRTSPVRGEIAMFLYDGWYTLKPRQRPADSDIIGSLDISILQEQILAPMLKIVDPRTDTRIDFIGGIHGTRALEAQVRSGSAAVAFSLHPVELADLMTVADRGEIMPPKSTWFEPKLRDGLLVQVIR